MALRSLKARIGLAGLAGALVALELLLKALAPLPDYAPFRPTRTYHRLLPSWNYWGCPPLAFDFNPGFLPGVSPGIRRVEVNRYGFLYPESAGSRRSPDELRIAVLGGSTVECIALRPDIRWPARVESLLRERWPVRPITVLNFGVSAQGSPSYLATLVQHVVNLDVDAVVILLGANDLRRVLAPYPHLMDPADFGEASIPGPRFFLSRLQIVRWARKALTPRAGANVAYFEPTRRATQALPLLPYSPRWTENAKQQYRRDIISLAAITRAHGIKELLLTQPMLWREDLSPEEQRLCWLLRYDHEGEAHRLTPGMAAALLDEANALLLGTCRDRDYHCLDLASRIPRNAANFYDDVHFSDAGSELVAEYVATALAERLGGSAPVAQ